MDPSSNAARATMLLLMLCAAMLVSTAECKLTGKTSRRLQQKPAVNVNANVDVNGLGNQISGALGDLLPQTGAMKEVKVQGKTWTGFFNDWQARDRLRQGMRNPINLNLCGARCTWYGVFEGDVGGNVCDKCNVPVDKGGCKCDNNCDCLATGH